MLGFASLEQSPFWGRNFLSQNLNFRIILSNVTKMSTKFTVTLFCYIFEVTFGRSIAQMGLGVVRTQYLYIDSKSKMYRQEIYILYVLHNILCYIQCITIITHNVSCSESEGFFTRFDWWSKNFRKKNWKNFQKNFRPELETE